MTNQRLAEEVQTLRNTLRVEQQQLAERREYERNEGGVPFLNRMNTLNPLQHTMSLPAQYPRVNPPTYGDVCGQTAANAKCLDRREVHRIFLKE